MQLVILTGLQGSGKSTFARTRFPTYVYVSKDQLRNNPRPERRQRELIARALAEGRSVIVDNTNPRVADRAPLIELGRARGAHLVSFLFTPDVRASIARNARRQGRERVPEVAIFTTARRLELPSPAEGFEELFRVEATGDGGFRVWRR
jgi:predicted kinase